MTKIAIVMGTRPEIIKLSPIIKLANKSNTELIFSGQHYDYDLGLRFFDDLGLRAPDFKIRLSEVEVAKQVGEIIQKLAEIFLSIKPETVVIQGDTNTVLAGAIAAIKCKIPVSHVEAGLRSFDWRMPEEHNRIITDHISELLFAPTQNSKRNLLNEKVHGKIFVTGNTVIDAIKQNLKLAEKKATIDLDSYKEFILATFHRAENVDNKKTLGDIVQALIECGQKIIFPIHPRTKRRAHQFGFYNKIKSAKNITVIDAVGYFDMISLMKGCRFIISDSGGIQEESTSPGIKKKVLVVRKTTDRPEAVKAGLSELVFPSKHSILRAMKRNSIDQKYDNRSTPYGNGNASQKILNIINKNF